MKKTTKPQTKPPVDREAVRVLAIELGAREAARRLGLNPNTVLSWAKRYNWNLPKRKGGATLKSAAAITLQSKPGDVLIASHKELEGATKTGLMLTAAKAATKAAQNPPLDVSSTSQFRDLATSSGRIFGWNAKAGPQTFNQVVISQEQLKQIGMLRDSTSPEEQEELSKKVLAMTPEEWEEFRRETKEWLERGQNMEQRKLPPTPPGPVTYEMKIRGDGGGVKITGQESNSHD
jgi:Putative ATPase subunit of terminase (gpP-like)